MRFGGKILRRPLCVVPEEKAQSRCERDTTYVVSRTQNPLSERTCGFKSLLRYLFSRGYWSSGDWLLPRTKCQTHSEPITWVQGNGLARFTSDCRGLQLDFLYMESVKQSLGLRLRHRRLPLSSLLVDAPTHMVAALPTCETPAQNGPHKLGWAIPCPVSAAFLFDSCK